MVENLFIFLLGFFMGIVMIILSAVLYTASLADEKEEKYGSNKK